MIALTSARCHSWIVILSSLLLLGFLLEVKPFFESARAKPAVLAARWLLWIGTAGLLAAVGTGFLQPGKSIMFRDTSGPLDEHRFLGIWTAAVFRDFAGAFFFGA